MKFKYALVKQHEGKKMFLPGEDLKDSELSKKFLLKTRHFDSSRVIRTSDLPS